MLRQAYAEQGIDDTVNWGQLIEEERQKRLSRIDAEADAVEERVLEIEADRAAREEAAEAARDRLDAKDADEKAVDDLAVPPGADKTPGPDGK